MRTAIATILLLGILTGSAWAYDRFVNPRGTCGASTVGGKPQHATIQEAVDAASPGDAIGVCPDTYFEGATVSPATPGISLTGIGVVIIQTLSSPSFNALEIHADDVTVQRFEIRDFEDAGIFVDANRATIQNNTLHDDGIGIALKGDGHRVRNNAVDAFFVGIFGDQVNAVEISGNRVTGGDYGIVALDVDQASPGTVVHHNLVAKAGIGISVSTAAGGTVRNNTVRFIQDTGIAADDTVSVSIVQNVVHFTGGPGIHVSASTDCGVGLNSVNFNSILGNGHGIDLEGIDGCFIARNSVTRNPAPACFWDGGGSNTFLANACASETPAGAWD